MDRDTELTVEGDDLDICREHFDELWGADSDNRDK